MIVSSLGSEGKGHVVCQPRNFAVANDGRNTENYHMYTNTNLHTDHNPSLVSNQGP